MSDYAQSVAIDGKVMMKNVIHLFLGLRSLHEAGILHRNICAKSLLINCKQQVKLGRYKFLDIPEDPAHSATVDDFGDTSCRVPELADVSTSTPHPPPPPWPACLPPAAMEACLDGRREGGVTVSVSMVWRAGR